LKNKVKVSSPISLKLFLVLALPSVAISIFSAIMASSSNWNCSKHKFSENFPEERKQWNLSDWLQDENYTENVESENEIKFATDSPIFSIYGENSFLNTPENFYNNLSDYHNNDWGEYIDEGEEYGAGYSYSWYDWPYWRWYSNYYRNFWKNYWKRYYSRLDKKWNFSDSTGTYFVSLPGFFGVFDERNGGWKWKVEHDEDEKIISEPATTNDSINVIFINPKKTIYFGTSLIFRSFNAHTGELIFEKLLPPSTSEVNASQDGNEVLVTTCPPPPASCDNFSFIVS